MLQRHRERDGDKRMVEKTEKAEWRENLWCQDQKKPITNRRMK